jgi:hypothetical protein
MKDNNKRIIIREQEKGKTKRKKFSLGKEKKAKGGVVVVGDVVWGSTKKKYNSPMIPIESCYYTYPGQPLNRPSRSFTKNLSHSEI